MTHSDIALIPVASRSIFTDLDLAGLTSFPVRCKGTAAKPDPRLNLCFVTMVGEDSVEEYTSRSIDE
jgi:hypothetical protein